MNTSTPGADRDALTAASLYRVGGNVITDELDVCLMKAPDKIDRVVARARTPKMALLLVRLLNEEAGMREDSGPSRTCDDGLTPGERWSLDFYGETDYGWGLAGV